MRMLEKARLRLRSLFRRPNVDVELEAELHSHLDQLIEENIAYGMPPDEVIKQILKQGLQVTALGAVIGLTGALAGNRLIASLLFDVQPTDAVTIAFVIATIMVVAVVASGLPAWRASRLDPNVVLRDE